LLPLSPLLLCSLVRIETLFFFLRACVNLSLLLLAMKRAAEGRDSDEENAQRRAKQGEERIVYWGSGSSAGWRVLLCLELKNLEYKSNMIEFSSGVLKTAEMIALNPRGQVPILIDTLIKTPIYESLAILMYLEKFYSPSLMPSDPESYSSAQMRMQEANNLSNAAGEVIQVMRRPVPDAECGPLFLAMVDKKKKALWAETALWEAYLDKWRDGPFLCGAHMTLSDISFYPVLSYCVRCGLELEQHFPGSSLFNLDLCYANSY
jgi:glutathione S-transferase